jgi:hypothetical protein
MKTIIRWAVGEVSDQGFACLRHSVRRIVDMYGSKDFEYFVCHNGSSRDKIGIRQKNVGLLDQDQFVDSLPIRPSNKFGVCWKLYPPRLDPSRLEIFIDNDIVLHKKIDFDRYEDACFISEAVKRSYGSFDKLIEGSVAMNSGIFGLPPGFDFGLALSDAIAKFDVKWDDSYFEEQGLVAYVISNETHAVLSKNDIGITWNNPSCFMGEYGTHFIGLNSGATYYWKKYRTIF